jgi:16S rRNA (adenine1518-N6/adenine1519-N6)-dimethyltransferase
MCQYLSKRFPSGAGFELIEQDILSFDLLSLNVKKLKVVGNLPYNITSKIVFKLLGELYEIQYPARVLIEQLTIMVQKEVAERLVAKPGEKAYNALSIAAQMWFDPRMAFVIPASSFYPQPKVQSAVVTFTPRALPRVPVEQMANLSKLIRAAFSQKRKTLRNALLGSGIASQEKIDWALQAANITPSLRAEALSIEQFGDLASAFSQNPS